MHVRPVARACRHLGIQQHQKAPRFVTVTAIPWPRLFSGFTGAGEAEQQGPQRKLGLGHMEKLHPRRYQQELINIAKDTNVLIALPTGSGKTLIAAEVIRHKLSSFKEAGKAVIFLAPTNPLVEQQCNEVLRSNKHGLDATALHGKNTSQSINSWNAELWQSMLSKFEVVVMTPEVLVLALCHGSLQMQNIGLLIFDEAHHCASDHPYAQIMEDFYHCGSTPDEPRPQILALTAFPKAVNKLDVFSQGLQTKLHATLLTVAEDLRSELRDQVPVPVNELVSVNDIGWPKPEIAAAINTFDAALKITSKAAACETLMFQLQKQAMLVQSGQMTVSADVQSDLECFAELNDEGGSVARIDKQVRAVRTCLTQLGPWGAAAAAYLDLLSGTDPEDDGTTNGNGDQQQQQLGFAADGSNADFPHEGQGDEGAEDAAAAAAAAAAAGSSVLSESDLWKSMRPDNLGKQPHELIDEFRTKILPVITWLQDTSKPSPHIISPTEVATCGCTALAAAAAAGSSGGLSNSLSTAALAGAAAGVLGLMSKAGIMVVMSMLADLLFVDGRAQTRFLNDPGLQRAAGDAAMRSDGGLRKFGEKLMQQVAWGTLQAQIFPKFAASTSAPAWTGPPLLSPKVVKIIQHLEYKRLEEDGLTATNNDWWSVMVFLETKLATMVICKLVQSLPDVSQRLKAGYLIGDTDPGGGISSISMNNKAQSNVVQQFRRGETNVLFATNIGSEGMDFKQCQAVVAFDPPNEVTQYIQARGRARKAGSRYYWLAPESLERATDPKVSKLAVSLRSKNLCLEAELMDKRIRELSNINRAALHPPALDIAKYNPSDYLCVPSGGVATLRQAQALLAAFCAKLPGSEKNDLLQAYYATKQLPKITPQANARFVTTVYLPSNSGILEPLIGPEKTSTGSAKRAAALEAIKKLYTIGKLDKHLQPSWKDPKHSAQLEAEAIATFMYDWSVEEPLKPKTVNFTPAGTGNFTVPHHQNITLHLHTFKLSSGNSSSMDRSQSQQQQQQVAVGTKRPLAAVTAGWQRAIDSLSRTAAAVAEHQLRSSSSSSRFDPDLLLNLAVGAPDRCAAVPGSSSSSSSRENSKVLSYGVLMWESVGDGGDDGLQWPAWTNKQQQQPHQVSLQYAGPVSLSPSELLHLMHYQQATDDHINWSSKRLLGVRSSDQQQQRQQQQHLMAKPFQLSRFQSVTQSWSPPSTAAASHATTSSTAAAAAAPDNAAAAQLLEGAQICYLFVPLQQQQQHMIDWQSIDNMSAGIKSFAQVAADTYGLASTSAEIHPAATTAAAAVPDHISSDQITRLGAQLRDRIVIAGHSSMLYRCDGLDLTMTPHTPAEFSWKCRSTPAAAAAGTSDQTSDTERCHTWTAGNHAEYYSKRYNVTGLNPDLPMMSLAGGGRGWKRGLGLLTNPLKPPSLQARGSKAIQSDITDLTSPEAAAAAANLFGVAQQQQDTDTAAAAMAEDPSDHQQQQQQYLPLELCWVLPLTAAAWADLLLLPAFMYRLNFLLRVRKLQQQLQQLANSSSSGSRLCPMFCVPRSDLLAAALSGSSAGEVFDQEGLEYLGDVVLKFIATNYLLQSEPDANEGDLSVKKARLVRNVQLYQAAQETPLLLRHHLHLLPYLQNIPHSHRNNSYTPTGWYPRIQGVATAAAAAATAGSSSSSDLSPIGLYSQGGVPERKERGKRLADGVEALIGAVYLTAAGAAAAAAAGSSDRAAPVSMAGIAAAAAFCEAVGVMPQGSAALACQPPVQDTFHIQQQGSAQTSRQSQQQQQQVEQILGYHFSNPSLVSQATTHVSVFGVISYQRLEFLGDALLDLMVSGWLVDQLAAALRQQHTRSVHVYAPAVLTRARAALVNNTHLGRAAAAAGLQQCINLRSKFLSKKMHKFAAAAAEGLQEEGHQLGSALPFRGGPVVAAAEVQDAVEAEIGWSSSDLHIWQQVWMSVSSLDEDVDRTDDGSLDTAAAAAAVDDGVLGDGSGSSKPSSHHPKPPKALADVVESLIGAVFVDSMAQQQQQRQRQQSAGAAVASWDAAWSAVQQLLRLS